MGSRFLAAVLCALALAGCGAQEAPPAATPASPSGPGFPAGWPSDAERTMKPEHAPTPYTAAQVRAGCAAGRVMVFREVAATDAPAFRWFKFTGGDAEQAEFAVAQAATPLGEPDAWTPLKVPWVGLQAHASFPKERTQVTFERAETPLGTHACMLYTITGEKDGKPKVTRFWFAFDLPGPPVRQTVTEGDALVMTSEMVRNVPPPR